MASPLPPDPYAALGVSKDADLGQIRTAHRKLVLKFHPDRIKGDNVDEKDKAKNEFQKVQQAYEILSDSGRRSRYDDQVKLAELTRDRLLRNAARAQREGLKSSAGSTFVRSELRKDGNYYEERAPPTSYFDSKDTFDDPIPHASARKYEAPYEKERKPPPPKSTERKDKPRTASPVGFSMRAAVNLKARAASAKERVRESHAKSQETRDRQQRRDRSEKHSNRRGAYAEDYESGTDSDTVTPRPTPKSSRPSPSPMPEPESMRTRPSHSRRTPHVDDDESYDEDSKWERHHKSSMDYIAESKKRPGFQRGDSDAYVYWGGDYTSGRRSGSDSERRPTSSRRSKPDESKPRPAMPVHSSAPSNLKPYVEERAPPRSKTNPYPSEQRAPPNLSRAQTMPVNKSTKKDTLPTRGSNLKHSETQDSGYYSSSNPHTPEMKNDSPPPSRENSKKKGSSTKYAIVTPESDDDAASTVRILNDEDSKHRRYRSPERERERDRDRERERDRDVRERDRESREKERDRAERERPRDRERLHRNESDSRVRPARPAPTSFPRNEFRHDTPTPRGSPPSRSGKHLFGEISSDERETPYSYQYNPTNVKQSSYRPPVTTAYSNPRSREVDDDFASGSTFRTNLRYPTSRRPSLQT